MSLLNNNCLKVFHKETNTTQHTSCFIEHINFSRKAKNIPTISIFQPGNKITPVLESIYIPRTLNTGTCISHGERRAGWPTLVCGPIQELVLATANWRETRERFWKTNKQTKPSEWTAILKISSRKKSLAVGEAYMAIFWPTLDFERRTF